MRAEIVNCFIEAFKNTMKNNGGFNLVKNQHKAKDVIDVGDKIGIVVDLYGTSTVQGKVVVTMSKEIALNIIGFMLGGTKVDTIDALGISALGEYANWITSGAARGMADLGEMVANFKFDIVQPDSNDIYRGKIYPSNGSRFISLDYSVDSYDLELAIAI